MTRAEKADLLNGFYTRLNRIHKLSKYAKFEFKHSIHGGISEQEREIHDTTFQNMMEEMDNLFSELHDNYIKLKQHESYN